MPLKQSEIDEIATLLLKTEEPDITDRLNDWEKEFIASISEQFASRQWLSEKQSLRLKKIVEGDDGTSKEGRGPTFGRPGFSYRDPETTRPRGGGFTGFDRSRSKDQSDDNDN